MSPKVLFALWGSLFVLCAGLGFVPEPSGLFPVAAILFFLPPAVLLYRAYGDRNAHTLRLVRNLSALSLLLTMVLLIVNFLTALSSETLGAVVHYILVIVSCPMICCGNWALSMFLWACLLMTSMALLKKT